MKSKQTNKYVNALKVGCEKIAEKPATWRILRLASIDLRVYHCEHHYIIYLIDGTEVVILAFLHERMNQVARLKARLTEVK